MPLAGTLVNVAAILAGGALGLMFRKGLPQKYMDAVMRALGLVIFGIGTNYLIGSKQILAVIISVILGTLVGTLLRLDERLKQLGDTLQSRITLGGGHFSEAFVTSTLLFCIGAMAITGSIQSGLSNDHTVLLAKSVMDGVTSIFFASTLGVGVLFSAVPIFLYQGLITLGSSFLAPVLSEAVVVEMSAAGGVAIMALALSMLDIKRLKVADMLPAIFFPIAVLPLLEFINGLFT